MAIGNQVIFYGNHVGKVKRGVAVIESQFKCSELVSMLEGQGYKVEVDE